MSIKHVNQELFEFKIPIQLWPLKLCCIDPILAFFQPLMPSWHQRTLQNFVTRRPNSASSKSTVCSDHISGLYHAIISLSAKSWDTHVHWSNFITKPFSFGEKRPFQEEFIRINSLYPFFYLDIKINLLWKKILENKTWKMFVLPLHIMKV